MSGVAPMDAAAKAAPAPQQVVGQPVPGPQPSASVPAGVGVYYGTVGTVNNNVNNYYGSAGGEAAAATASASRGASPPRHGADGVPVSWQLLIEFPDGKPTHIIAPPDAPLRQSVSASLLWDGRRLWRDGERLSLDRTPRENGLENGAMLQLCQSQRGGGSDDATAVADDVAMADASEGDDDESLSPEELGRRLVARGDPPPSPNPANAALGLAYNAAVEAASAAAASASAAAAASSAAANSPAASASGGESDMDIDAELFVTAAEEYEAAIQAEQEPAPAPSGEPAAGGAALQGAQPQSQLAAAVVQLPTGASGRHVVVPGQFMPPIRGTKVPYTPPGATDAVEIDIEPQHSYMPPVYGSITLASPWMGGGKTTAKREYQKALIRESPSMRLLDLDCNRIYSMSNAVNLKKTAAELRADGLSHVTAAGYLDQKQMVDLTAPQMVGCSFESLFKLEGQYFGLVTLDELSALALKVGGLTMQHFECVFVMRDLLAQPGTRVLALDAAAHFKMSDTEPATVVEHFFQLVAPRRKVLSVALDPANMPEWLRRRLRVYYGADKGQVGLFWLQFEGAIAAWQADNSQLILVAVGTKSIGRKEVCSRLLDKGVPFGFYHGDSNEMKRFRDLADPGTWWVQLGAVVTTTVVGRGVDLPGPNDTPPLNVSRVFVVMERSGCDFGDQFQTMLRARHVQNAMIEVLLSGTMAPEQRARLVREGKRKPIVRPTYEQMLKHEKARRGWALRAAERQARAAGVASGSTPAPDPLLRVMAHASLNRQMQLVDPVYVLQRYAAHYGMPIEAMAPQAAQAAAQGQLQLDEAMAQPAAQAAAQGQLQLDEDEAFDVNASPEEKWAIVARTIRERGELGFFNDQCWGLATDEKRKSNTCTALELWLVKAFHVLKHIGELPELPNREQPDGGGEEGGGEEGGGEEGGGEEGGGEEGGGEEGGGEEGGGEEGGGEEGGGEEGGGEEGGGEEGGGEEGGGEEGGGEEGGGEEGGGEEGGGEEGGGEEGGAGGEESDPAAVLLFKLLGNGSSYQELKPALDLQAHCLIRTPEEQMRQDDASKLESALRGKPPNHEHCEYGLGQKMAQVERLGKLLLRGGYRHVRQVFDTDGNGIVANANAALVAAANRQILKQTTDEDTQLLQQLQQIAEQLKVPGKKSTIIEVLRGLGKAMSLELEYETEKPRQPDGTRKSLVRADPGLRFERVLPEVVDKWLVWSLAHGAKVSVADWQHAHAEQQLQRAEDATAADDHDYGDLFSAPFNPPADGTIGGNANARIELLDGTALQRELRRLQEQCEGPDGSSWMDGVPKPMRDAWSAGQKAAYARHLRCSSTLATAKAIDREAEPPDERGVRVLPVFYGKNSLGLGRRTASAPSMQHCKKELRSALCRVRYHDVDMVSCHPTLMLQVVRKMVAVGAIQWSDTLNALAQYAALNASGEPTGRMPMLLRIADHFGIAHAIAKDVCKTLVLRVLNGGSVVAWIREMGIDAPAEEQTDLRDLAEAARIVREAFFKMLERDLGQEARAKLKASVAEMLQDRHQRRVQAAQRNGEALPQPPSTAARDRTMFSHIMFDLEDRVLDCIDRKLRALGWTVASLIYDGLHVEHRDGADLTAALREAEAAVTAEHDYKIALIEKPMYDPAGAADGAADDGAAADGAADLLDAAEATAAVGNDAE